MTSILPHSILAILADEPHKLEELENYVCNNNVFLIDINDIKAGNLPTHTEFGLEWVEDYLRKYLPNCKIYNPLYASMLYGAYLDEFDEWRGSLHEFFSGITNFQGCLIESDDLRGFAINFKKPDNIVTWHNKSIHGNNISLLVLDNSFLRLSWASFYYLIGQQYQTEMAIHEKFNNIFDTWKYNFSLESNFKFNNDQINVINLAARGFQKALSHESEHSLTDYTKNLIKSLLSARFEPTEQDWYLRNYCESIAIHFLYAHEFGHHCYEINNAETSNKLLKHTNNWREYFSPYNEGLSEELFCDYMGILNCWFRLKRVEMMPTSIFIYMIIWVVIFTEVMGNLDQKRMQNRISTIGDILRTGIAANHAAMTDIVQQALSDLEMPARIFNECINIKKI